MRNKLITLVIIAIALCVSCSNTSEKRLFKKMKPLAEQYLADCDIIYDSLRIDCIDTINELNYANLNIELLHEMEDAYLTQYQELIQTDTVKAHYVRLYLRDIQNTLEDLTSMMENGELDNQKLLLYMVSGYSHEGKEKEPFIFFVQPDLKTLYTMDPFGDNLLYREEK